jgi:hypothetical protein
MCTTFSIENSEYTDNSFTEPLSQLSILKGMRFDDRLFFSKYLDPSPGPSPGPSPDPTMHHRPNAIAMPKKPVA